MCCAAPAGVPRTRLALESRWILTIALSLKSLFTSARMSIIEATCATTSPELYLQCVLLRQEERERRRQGACLSVDDKRCGVWT